MKQEKLINIAFGNSDSGNIRQFLLNYINERKKNVVKGEQVSLDFSLDLGKISGDFIKNRQETLEMTGLPFEFEENDIKEITQSYAEKIEYVIQKAREGYKFRVWTSDACFVRCGYYFFMDMLRDIDVDIEEWYINMGTWSNLDYELYDTFEPTIKRPSQKEKEEYSNKWQHLKENETGLRVVLDGAVVNVSEDYYDDKIRSKMPKNDTINTWKLCGRVLGELGEKGIYIHMEVILHRIYLMIKSGEFEVVETIPGDRPLNEIIRWKRV